MSVETTSNRTPIDLYRQLLDSSSDPIFCFAPNFRYVYANQALADGIGRNLEEIIGKTLWDVFPKDEADKRAILARWVFDHGEAKLHEILVQGPNGARHYLTTMTPVFGNQGQVSYALANSKDITKRKQAESVLKASEEKYRALVETTSTGYLIIDREGKVVDANPEYVRLTGCNELREIVGRSVLDWTAEYEQERNGQAVARCARDGFIRNLVIDYVDRNGRITPVEINATVNGEDDSFHIICLCRDITERKQAQQQLEASEERLQLALGGGELGFWDWNIPNGEVLYSDQWFSMLGLPQREARLNLDSWIKLIHPDDLTRVNAALDSHLKGHAPVYECEHRVRHQDGRWLWLLDRGKVVEWDMAGAPFRLVGTYFDITQRKLTEAKIQLAASVFSHAREGITITDAQGTIIDINEAFSRITGYSRVEAIGQNPRILSSGRQDKAFYVAMWNALIVEGHWSGEIWNRRKSGEVYAELLTISAVRDGQGNTLQYVALFSDITGIKEHQRQLEHIAHFDALTSLPNRLLLADRLQQAMAQAQRRGQQVAVTYLDLDGFKNVNDQHGHDAGDQLLMHLANAMKDTLREGDTLARLGGDEFVAVLIDLDGLESCVPMLTRLLDAAAQPLQFGAATLQVSGSIGVTFFPQAHDVEADQLLRQADQAMYQAKLAGKNRFQVFDAAHDSSLRVHHESLERIRLALVQGEFVLHYQPKVNMRSGKVIGAEALIRWQHPEKGMLAPATFLPVIEEHPLAVEVGEWVIDTALTQIEKWNASGLELSVSVNIGARQLQQSDFVQRLQAILADHPRVKPASVELEVLETSALADMEQVSQVIETCHQMGVRFALDDFGTGYSSLTYLKRLRVAMLKIDQSFVRDMLDDPDDRAILEGVIGLAVAFKRDVIAEGVETVAHGTLLLQLGCQLAQGYGIARPMPPQDMAAWVATWQPDDAWSAVDALPHMP